MAKDLSSEVLSAIEKDKAIQFAKDPIMLMAVKKYVLASAFKQGVVSSGEDFNGNVNFALNLSWGATSPHGTGRTDEELGQNLRALTYAVQLVESGFKEIADMEEPEPLEVKNKNEAE